MLKKIFKHGLSGLKEGFVGLVCALFITLLLNGFEQDIYLFFGILFFGVFGVLIIVTGNIANGLLGFSSNSTFKSHVKRSMMGGLFLFFILAIVTLITWPLSINRPPLDAEEFTLTGLLISALAMSILGVVLGSMLGWLGQNTLLSLDDFLNGRTAFHIGWKSRLFFAVLFGAYVVATNHPHWEQAIFRGFIAVLLFTIIFWGNFANNPQCNEKIPE